MGEDEDAEAAVGLEAAAAEGARVPHSPNCDTSTADAAELAAVDVTRAPPEGGLWAANIPERQLLASEDATPACPEGMSSSDIKTPPITSRPEPEAEDGCLVVDDWVYVDV